MSDKSLIFRSENKFLIIISISSSLSLYRITVCQLPVCVQAVSMEERVYWNHEADMAASAL